MRSIFPKALVVTTLLALTGCSVCNITQTGSQRWAFDGVVTRVYAPGDLVPVSSSFRYELEFGYQQPDTNPAAGEAAYVYRAATLTVSDAGEIVFQAGDDGGAIELGNMPDHDWIRAISDADSTTWGALPTTGKAASRLEFRLDSRHLKVEEGPLTAEIDSVMPPSADVGQFTSSKFGSGKVRVEFAGGDSFVEGEVRGFQCVML